MFSSFAWIPKQWGRHIHKSITWFQLFKLWTHSLLLLFLFLLGYDWSWQGWDLFLLELVILEYFFTYLVCFHYDLSQYLSVFTNVMRCKYEAIFMLHNFSKQGCGAYPSGLWRCWWFHSCWKIKDKHTCEFSILPHSWCCSTFWTYTAYSFA